MAVQMIKDLIQLGITQQISPSKKKQIKLINQMALIFMVAISIKAVMEIIDLDWLGIGITGALNVAYGLTLLINYFQKYKLARVYFLIINAMVMAVLNLAFGQRFGVEFILFPLIIFVVMFFKSRRVQLLWWSIFALFYISSKIYISHYEPFLLHNLSFNSFYFMLAVTTLLVFIMANVYISDNHEFEDTTNKLLDTLKSKNKELKNANKELERFAYVASHDLKTPLRNINSFIQLIQRNIQKGEKENIPEYLDYVSLYAKRMNNLIEDILEFSRFNTESVSLTNMDLNEVVNQSVSNLNHLIESKKAKIQIAQLPVIRCNASQMVSLFQNLIENGIKYNKSPIPVVKIEFKDTPEAYHIYVKDNGIGIPKEYQSKVFDMFYRLHNVEEYDGTGIGLATSLKIIHYHDGEITIIDSSEKGTIFQLLLPKIKQVQKREELRATKSGKEQSNLA